MAANEYYNTGYNQQQPSWNHGNAPGSHQPYSNPYGPENSQYNLNSDNDVSTVGGKYHSNEYADDIPLKPNASQPGRPEWADVETQYAPGQNQQTPPPPVTAPGRSKRKGRSRWKRIPWVVYITSIIQVAVFIAELAKNGTL